METLYPTRQEDLLRFAIDILTELSDHGVGGDHGYLFQDKYLKILERSSDPEAPANGQAVIWVSDGTGKGDAGDVMIASTTGGATKYTTLFDQSGGAAW